ncbi:hypothetical protein DFA_09204 [Cavenderia fasciculata]|uniref:Uncharacterized protein n=1 Tax=Cavenderia fasciculata TaxID=261658 RepID=F4Q6Z4_CACFS|nr:uncharacterized protein DFA_09204 [Cavenderia fasciculata]EGG16176.1 hypothetical protein DFA_09204 [Cavenderia fasciculata]|eukprot:XP_004352629.1 hypothetical protein DFA_09204 [Cavenderia fasciculata]
MVSLLYTCISEMDEQDNNICYINDRIPKIILLNIIGFVVKSSSSSPSSSLHHRHRSTSLIDLLCLSLTCKKLFTLLTHVDTSIARCSDLLLIDKNATSQVSGKTPFLVPSTDQILTTDTEGYNGRLHLKSFQHIFDRSLDHQMFLHHSVPASSDDISRDHNQITDVLYQSDFIPASTKNLYITDSFASKSFQSLPLQGLESIMVSGHSTQLEFSRNVFKQQNEKEQKSQSQQPSPLKQLVLYCQNNLFEEDDDDDGDKVCLLPRSLERLVVNKTIYGYSAFKLTNEPSLPFTSLTSLSLHFFVSFKDFAQDSFPKTLNQFTFSCKELIPANYLPDSLTSLTLHTLANDTGVDCLLHLSNLLELSLYAAKLTADMPTLPVNARNLHTLSLTKLPATLKSVPPSVTTLGLYSTNELPSSPTYLGNITSLCLLVGDSSYLPKVYPSSLKILKLSCLQPFKIEKGCILEGIETLHITSLNTKIEPNSIPNSIKNLIMIDCKADLSTIGPLPNQLEYLGIKHSSGDTNHCNLPVSLPPTLRRLSIGNPSNPSTFNKIQYSEHSLLTRLSINHESDFEFIDYFVDGRIPTSLSILHLRLPSEGFIQKHSIPLNDILYHSNIQSLRISHPKGDYRFSITRVSPNNILMVEKSSLLGGFIKNHYSPICLEITLNFSVMRIKINYNK